MSSTESTRHPRRPWALPSAVAQEFDPSRAGRGPRRTVRDWFADFTCFGAAVLLGMLGADAISSNPHVSQDLADFDQVVGAFACAAVWLRRRWPVGLAIAMVRSAWPPTPRAARRPSPSSPSPCTGPSATSRGSAPPRSR